MHNILISTFGETIENSECDFYILSKKKGEVVKYFMETDLNPVDSNKSDFTECLLSNFVDDFNENRIN